MPKRSQTVLFLAVCALTVLGVVFALDRMTGLTGLEQTEARDHLGWTELEAPIKVGGLSGLKEVNTAGSPDLSGTVLVNIWGSWCEPCKHEMPWLQGLADSGVGVLGISRDRRVAPAATMIESYQITYPNYLDVDGVLHRALGGKVPLQGIPTSLLIVDGKVTWVHVGVFASAEDLERGVQARIGS